MPGWSGIGVGMETDLAAIASRAKRHASEPRYRAEDLIYEASEAAGPRRAVLARKALALWSDCADGYVLLEQARRALRRRASCLSAVSPQASARWGRWEPSHQRRALGVSQSPAALPSISPAQRAPRSRPGGGFRTCPEAAAPLRRWPRSCSRGGATRRLPAVEVLDPTGLAARAAEVAARQRSPETRRTYAAVYRTFTAFLGPNATAEDMTRGNGARLPRSARARRANAGDDRQAPLRAAQLAQALDADPAIRTVRSAERRARRAARPLPR